MASSRPPSTSLAAHTGETYLHGVRIYYEDTDAAGIVYHANYLKFAERARSEWLRSLGWSQCDLRDRYGIAFVVVSAQISYHAPAYHDDWLEVSCHPVRLQGSRLVVDHRVYRGEALLVSIETVLACINTHSMLPARIPQALLALLAAP